MGAVFYSVYGILQFFGYMPKGYWSEANSLASRFTNNAPFAAYINMNLFICLGMISGLRRHSVKIVFFVILPILLSALILTKSRIAWIISFSLLICFSIIVFNRLKAFKHKRVIILTISCLIVLLTALSLRNFISERFGVLIPTQFQSVVQRMDVWKGTLKLIFHRPWGVGIGGFQYAYPAFRTHSDRFFIDYAHSEYLQTAADIGVIGLVVFLWFIWSILRSYKAAGCYSDHLYFIRLGLFFSLLSLFLQALFDYPLRIPSNALLFVVMSGLAVSNIPPHSDNVLIINARRRFVLILFALACGFFYTCSYVSESLYQRGLVCMKNFDFDTTVNYSRKAARFMPLRSDAYAQVGGVYSLKSSLVVGEGKTSLQKNALASFSRAAQLNSYNADYYLNLAWLHDSMLQREEALVAFKRAVEVNPMDSEYYFFFGDYCLDNGFLVKALDLYRQGMSLFINDDGTFFRRYKSVYGLFERIYSHTHDPEMLRMSVPNNKINIRLTFAQFLEDKGLSAEGLEEYKEILKVDPVNPRALKAIERLGS